MVAGSPRMCMPPQPAPASAATGHSEADTSFTSVAPAATAASATAAERVSTETRTDGARASITGTTRRRCSASSTAWAPSATSVRPWAIARSGSRKRPPSEKESGVTFSTPMTRGPTARTVPGRLAAADQLHGLVPGGDAVPELPPHGRRGGHRPRRAHAPHGHAEVLGLDHHEDTSGLEAALELVGDLGREPLLDLQAAGE